MLRSLLPAPLRARLLPDSGADAERAFALVVIAIINLNGGKRVQGCARRIALLLDTGFRVWGFAALIFQCNPTAGSLCLGR